MNGEERRDAALAQVGGHNQDWMIEGVLLAAVNLCPSEEVTGEEIQERLIHKGLGHPKHHNAWGALIRQLVSAKLLQPTGRVRKMKKPSSHARQTLVWQVTRYEDRQ